MRSRRVILNGSPNSNTRAGTYRGKTAPVPMHDSHSWRNPGGPIGPPAGDKTASYAAAKPDYAGKHADTHGRAGRNVRRQHPYAGNKHFAKTTAKGRQQGKQNLVQQSSSQRTGVHNSAKQSLPNPVPATDKATQTKPKRTLAATFCGYLAEKEEDQV